MNKFGFPCSKPRQSYQHGWHTGDIAAGQGVVGRIVVQSATRLEIRVEAKRIGGQLHQFTLTEGQPEGWLHSRDAYNYV